MNPRNTPLLRLAVLFVSLPLAVVASRIAGSPWAGLIIFAAGLIASVALGVIKNLRSDSRQEYERRVAKATLSFVQLFYLFGLTAAAVGLGDYFINRSVGWAVLLGIGCGFVVVHLVRNERPRDGS